MQNVRNWNLEKCLKRRPSFQTTKPLLRGCGMFQDWKVFLGYYLYVVLTHLGGQVHCLLGLGCPHE